MAESLNHRHFADELLKACREKHSRLIVGLDPHPAFLPPALLEKHHAQSGRDREAIAAAIAEFNLGIIRSVADHVVAVKPQLAFYEQWGPPGMAAYEAAVEAAHAEGLLVIADGKRNDIGSSAEGYAQAYLGSSQSGSSQSEWSCRNREADAITVNPYLGSDGVRPFLKRWRQGKGAFALVRTSNPSAGEIQDLQVDSRPMYMCIAELVRTWGADLLGESGYSALGAVVGATDPTAARQLRQAMPATLFLVPGFGAQGGKAADVAAAFNPDGYGAVVNSSRAVLFAYRDASDAQHYASAARAAAADAKAAINQALSG